MKDARSVRLRPKSIVWRVLLLVLIASAFLSAQSLSAQSSNAEPKEPGRLILVLPFENHTGQINLQWIGDSFPDTLNKRLNSAGFLTIARDDRLYAMDHLGFPTDFKPTHATTLRIAQTLDADFVVFGSYSIQKARVEVQAQVLAVNKLALSAPLVDSGELTRLFDIENAVAWKVARQIDPTFSVAEQTFLSASGGVRLTAFENYIRGVASPTEQDRIKRLQAAVQDEPTYEAALLALGKSQYSARMYAEAAATLAKIPHTARAALEANFYLGLARFNAAKYAEAEAAFAFVASRLPLPEVVNNQGVAASRQGHDAGALFQRASAADPNDAGYHFNLAVSLLRRGDAPGVTRELDAALKLHAADPEAVELRNRVAAARTTGVGLMAAVVTGGFEPVERIRRSYSEASFRQAAFQMDQMRAARLAALPFSQQAAAYIQQGQDYLAQGLIPEAELQFQSAIAADPRSASAHAGLAQIREQSGSAEAARAEANASLQLKPNAAAYLVLARLDLQANQLASSAANVAKALALEPNNSPARGMQTALKARGQSVP